MTIHALLFYKMYSIIQMLVLSGEIFCKKKCFCVTKATVKCNSNIVTYYYNFK